MTDLIYTLTIEDRVEGRVVQVDINGSFQYKVTYNPKKETGPFNPDGPFDTSFSIVHPFRELANQIAQDHYTRGNLQSPQPQYNSSVNQEQRQLFENILAQEFGKVRKEKNVYPAKRESGWKELEQ
jgi:hypothetical protein